MVLHETGQVHRVKKKGSVVVVILKEFREQIKIEQGTILKVGKNGNRLI